MNAAVVAGCVFALALLGCQREERDYRSAQDVPDGSERVVLTTLFPGFSRPPAATSERGRRYETNAYHLNQGKLLYSWFNCQGCHFHGGGGIGPPLMAHDWRYGSSVEDIAATIRQGRPNGMPSFAGKIPDRQIWEIAAYVRSISGNVPSDAAPNRSDHMHARPAENRQPE